MWGAGRSRAGPYRAGHHRARDGRGRVAPRRVPQGGPPLRPHAAQDPGQARLDGRRRRDGRARATPNTVLVVGSAPQYPQGVQDDIPAIAALAASIGANCHVDACMGGFVLPFVEMLGREVPPWDFRVDGRHDDLGRHPQARLRPQGRVGDPAPHQGVCARYQTFVFDDWLGGFYASPNMQGTRSGLPMACAWAVMSHLGIDGYVDLTRRTLANADAFRAGVAAIDGIRVLGDGRFHLVAMAPTRRSSPRSTSSRSATRCSPRVVPRSSGTARHPALDDQQLEHRRDRRVPGRPRRVRRRGRRHPHRRPLHELRHARVTPGGPWR